MSATLTVRASGGMPRLTNPCAYPAVRETTTNKINVVTCAFDPAAIEYWQSGGIDLPSTYDGGTFTAQITWRTNDAGAGETVRWGVQLLILTNDEADDTAFGSAQYAEQNVGTAAYDKMTTDATSAITAGGTPSGTKRTLYIQVFRDATHANDDLSSDAELEAVTLTFGTS